jgi:hypothetical protein
MPDKKGGIRKKERPGCAGVLPNLDVRKIMADENDPSLHQILL